MGSPAPVPASNQTPAPTVAAPAAPGAQAAQAPEDPRKTAVRGLDYDSQVAALAPPPGAQPVGAAPAVDGPAAARALLPAIREQEAAQRAEHAKLSARQAELEQQLAGATGDKQAELAKAKKDVDEKLGKADANLKQLDADARALEAPGTTPDTYNRILARQKQAGTVAPVVEQNPDKDNPIADKKWSERKDTRVETGYGDGKAVKKVDETVDKVGVGTAERTKTSTVEEVNDKGVSKSTDSTKVGVSKDGLSYEKKNEKSAEVDGKTSSKGSKTTVNVGPGGASVGASDSRVNADGSKQDTSAKVGVERGDGKAGASASVTSVKTDANGREVTAEAKAKGGIIAGKDGVGGYAGVDGKYESKSSDDVKIGAVGGLDGNVVCNVEKLDGEPPRYALSLTVSLAGKLGLSAAKDKENDPNKRSVGVSGEASASMAVRKVMSAEETKAYLERLKAANGGAGGGDKELAIIAVGVTKGWDAARQMYEGAKAAAGDAKALDGMKDGDKVEVKADGKVGGSGEVGGGAGPVSVGVSAGYEVGQSGGMSVEKKDGKLVFTTSRGDSDKGTVGASAGVGVVKGSASVSSADRSSTTYVFTLDPSDKAAIAALQACKTQAELDAFAKAHPAAIGEVTKAKGHEDGQKASVGVGPVSVGVAYGASYDESKTTDGQGKLKSATLAGANSGGIEIAAGPVKLADGAKESATTQVDGDGNTTVDVNQKDTKTDAKKLLAAVVPLAGDKADAPPDGGPGVLSKVTGGDKSDKDTTTTSVSGMKLGGADLDGLAAAAQDQGKWMSHCPSPRLRDDWAQARRDVLAAGGDRAAVGKALSQFVGKGGHGRDDVIYAAVRGPGAASGGSRYEFPDGLGSLKPEYDAIVIGDPVKPIADVEAKDGAAKAIAAGQAVVGRLDSLYATFQTAQGKFDNAATFGEMVGAITRRKEEVQAKLRVLGGGKADVLSAKEWVDKYNGLLGDCQNMKAQETAVFDKIEASWKDGHTSLDESIENGKLIKQLRDLHAQWQPKYDAMAQVAQEHDLGKDVYWKYKPDAARFGRALSGRPGDPTPAAPEQADKRAKKDEPARAAADPVGDSGKQLDQQRQAQATGVQAKIQPAKSKAYGAGNRLLAWLQNDRKASAVAAHNQGMNKIMGAETWAKRLPKQATTEDWESYGVAAVQDFEAAYAAFAEGLALYPAGSPPKA